MITQQDIQELCKAATYADFKVKPDRLELLIWNAGPTHVLRPLPADNAAIYIFKWNDIYLKVGKVNSNSTARYHSHHYTPGSSLSNLSKSLLSDPDFQALVGIGKPGEWIRANTTRFNILIPSVLPREFVHFAEAFFILKCRPKFEGTKVINKTTI